MTADNGEVFPNGLLGKTTKEKRLPIATPVTQSAGMPVGMV
jgi:hypothetical protein